jgi:hypothetical protein
MPAGTGGVVAWTAGLHAGLHHSRLHADWGAMLTALAQVRLVFQGRSAGCQDAEHR